MPLSDELVLCLLLIRQLSSCGGRECLSNGVRPGTFLIPAANGSLAHSVCRGEMLRKRVNKANKMETHSHHTHTVR